MQSFYRQAKKPDGMHLVLFPTQPAHFVFSRYGLFSITDKVGPFTLVFSSGTGRL